MNIQISPPFPHAKLSAALATVVLFGSGLLMSSVAFAQATSPTNPAMAAPQATYSSDGIKLVSSLAFTQVRAPANPVIATPSTSRNSDGIKLANSVVVAQAPAPANPAIATPSATRSSDGIKLDFVNAEIAEVAKTFGVILNRNFVVDPRVKGQMNLTTEVPVHPGLAYRQFLVALRLQGFTVVDSAGIYKVVPEAEAKLQGGSVSVGEVKAGGNQIITQIFRLSYENANNLVTILRPLISPNNTINVNPGNNSLVITDYADNLQRIAKIVAALDVSNATDLEIFPLNHALAADLVPLLIRLSETGGGAGAVAGQGQADTSFRTSIIAEQRSNAVIVRAANPARLSLIRSLIRRLDQPPSLTSNGDAGNIYVVHLKNADAVKLAATLRAAMSADAAPAAARPPAPAGAAAPAQASAPPSTGGQIQADTSSNSLIITAAEPQYRQMRAVIEKLDQRRAQVFVESLIAEVNSDRAAEFGIQWQSAIGKEGNKNIGVLGTNFGTAGSNIINLAIGNGQSLPGKGINLGLLRETGGVYVLGALARFLETTGDGNVLSTPNLLTLDNEEAKIVIGQNVPFVTGQFTNTGASGGNSVNPFQTIERKDVGLTLRVKPQISENGSVKLQIFQEVSNVQASSINSPGGLITNKRSIESNVVVEDGGIIVLGGLLTDEFSGNEEKVPGLGDVPLFGNLFKSQTRNRKKSNLMVFLRPIVVRDAQQTDTLSLDRYELMRAGQKESQPTPSSILGINEAPVMPPQLPSGGAGKTPAPFVNIPASPPPVGRP
jgi:general secretion pathway protein D